MQGERGQTGYPGKKGTNGPPGKLGRIYFLNH